MAGDGIKTHRVMRENGMRLLRGRGGEEKQSSFAFVLARGFVTATTRDAMHRSAVSSMSLSPIRLKAAPEG
jgi:hypothetical protein